MLFPTPGLIAQQNSWTGHGNWEGGGKPSGWGQGMWARCLALGPEGKEGQSVSVLRKWGVGGPDWGEG